MGGQASASRSSQQVGRFGVLYSDYRSDPMRSANSAGREGEFGSQSRPGQGVVTLQWKSPDTAVQPKQFLQDSTMTPASIMLDDMLETPPRLSQGQAQAPGVNLSPSRLQHRSSHSSAGWPSHQSSWILQKSSEQMKRDGVRRFPGTWTNGSYLGEDMLGLQGHQEIGGRAQSATSASSLPDTETPGTRPRPKVVPPLWRAGNTPRTPGNSVNTNLNYGLSDNGDVSEYSSSDDDTSYGGKKV
jgi:hypothetical protein